MADLLAAEAATEIVWQKLEILLCHPVCVECLLVATLAKDAKAKLAWIREYLSTVDRRPPAMERFNRLITAMSDAEEFIDKFHLRYARWRHVATGLLTVLVPKCLLWRDLSLLVKEMGVLYQDQYLLETEGERKREPASSSSYTSDLWQGVKLMRLSAFWDQRASTNFVWREAEKKKIMKRIREGPKLDNGHVISILGDQGTGKTYLARWVYREAMYLGCNSRAWVHVSDSMDKQEFLFKILKQVEKLERDVMNINEITKMLSKKLANSKSFLIVLDDVPQSQDQLLQSLLNILDTKKGCIIITTRSDDIANKKSSNEDQMKLGKLDHEEIQKMLAWKQDQVIGGQRLLEEKDILNMCPGLPLSISLFDGLLSNAGEDERPALAKEVSTMTLLDILQLSCHKLPVHLKPCFIYMALFPVAFPIPTRRLVRLWSAEGLLDSHCYDEERKLTRLPEDVGETFILELAARNMIDVVSWRADGSPKACQMVTSLYDMILATAMSTKFLHIHAASKLKDGSDHGPTSQQQKTPAPPPERVRWLAEHTNMVKDGSKGSFPALNLVRSFLSFYQRRGMLSEDIGKFLRKLTSKTGYSLLRVLDLEGVHNPSLQGVLHKLVLLRYLGLRSTLLDSIPCEVADLHSLETLDIKHTNIASLPSSLWKTRKLRHLHLNWFYIDLKEILKACDDNVMSLSKLQTLSGLVIGEVKENSMRNHMDRFTTLTTLKLLLRKSVNDIPDAAAETVAKWISLKLTKLQSLTFGVIKEATPEEEAQLAKKAKKVPKPAEKAQPSEVAKPRKEAQITKKTEPATSHIGLLPVLELAEHYGLLELYLLGQLNKPIWHSLLPGLLRVLTLSGSKLEIDMMPQLGVHLKNLRTFKLLANSFQCAHLRFIKDGFPSLMILKIWKLPKLEKVTIERGAMLRLQELEFRRLDAMKHVEGINKCKELENICVVVEKGAHDFVDLLKDSIGKNANLYKPKDSKMPEEDDRNQKEEILYLHVEKEMP